MTNLPEKIGRYEIAGELGRGAMGVVYKATDPMIGRKVALKTMRLDVHGSDEEEILRRFKHEAKLAGVMNHPNIVTIYDAGEHEGVFYIAMEFMEGVTLQSILHEQRIVPAEKILEISRHMCEGLDYAHQRGVIHRDIKPANIMIETENVKIMDFGIAKAGGGMTSAGQVLGTPAYMSPEQVRGKTLDGRSDLFSYGVCLYEMATGEKPFQGQNVTTIIYKIMTEEPIPPRELDVTIHPGISAVIIKALAKNPDHRHQSGADLLKELENYKSFGTDIETTKVIAATSTGAHPAMASGPPATAPKAAAAAASALPHGELPKAVAHAPAKAGAAASSDSTVKVAKGGKNTSPAATGSRKQAIIAAAAVVLLSLGIVLYKKIASPPVAPAQPVSAQTNQVQTNSSPVSEPAQSEAKKPESQSGVENASADPAPVVPKKEQPKPKQVAAIEAPATVVPLASTSTPELGSMHISSTPAGAKVTIGSTSQDDWITPFTAQKLAPGDYELTFTKAGFITQKRHVSVIAGKSASMGIDLAEAGAKVTVNSTPAGANILVDDKPTGKVTPASLVVAAGTHEITARLPGGQAENVSITLKDGESYTFSPNLDAKRAGGGANPFRKLKKMFGGEQIPEGKGMVQIKTNPEGAVVMHKGKAWPQLTPIKGPMDPGTYQVTIRMEGYKPVRREFVVEKGKTTEVVAELEHR